MSFEIVSPSVIASSGVHRWNVYARNKRHLRRGIRFVKMLLCIGINVQEFALALQTTTPAETVLDPAVSELDSTSAAETRAAVAQALSGPWVGPFLAPNSV